LINFAAIIKTAMRFIVYAIFFLISFVLVGQEKSEVVVIRDTVNYLQLIGDDASNELINLEGFVPGLKLDIRYATSNNISGEPLYVKGQAFVRKPVAVSMAIIQDALNRRGLGLKIFDAYRPYAVAEKLAEQLKNSGYAGFSENNTKHSRGASVDVSLISLASGEEIQMPTDYCQNSEATRTNYRNLPDNVRNNREILIQVMQQHGFRVSPDQWWHFDFMGWQAFSLMDLSFEELEIFNKNMN
jgi:D-alanyl-D-alanine dipeptidase